MDNTIISAIIGALSALLIFLLGQYYQKSIRKNAIMEALISELKGNKRIGEKSIEKNNIAIDSLTESELKDNNYKIDDESQLFITPHIDIPIEQWINKDLNKIASGFPVKALVDYKLALQRTNYLITRNQAFRYRPHYIVALISAQKELLDEIRRLNERIDQAGLNE